MKRTLVIVPVLAFVGASCEEKPAPLPASAPAAPKPAAAVPVVPAAPAATGLASGELLTLGVKFTVPEGWNNAPPSNSMRLAELRVPDASGDASKDCVAVFSTAGGDVQSNIDRWAGQVRDATGQPSKPVVTKKTVGGMNVSIVEMTGAFSPGMSDPKTYENWTMRAAIVETPRGLLFIKMTGPAEAMKATAAAFGAMVDGLKG